jgi:hypothetical protein
MKIGYFDCGTGAGGDMIVASLLHAGIEKEYLIDQLDKLGIKELEFDIKMENSGGITGFKFTPKYPNSHTHRHFSGIKEMIQSSKLSEFVKENAIAIFTKIAYAEAKIHDKPIEKIHFHEVGALDSISDVVAACICFEKMACDKYYCSRIAVGSGTFKCDHGTFPVPAPATVEILKDTKLEIHSGPYEMELFTPTAAAVMSHFVSDSRHLPPMKIEKIGYGIGTKKIESAPNAIRFLCGRSQASPDDSTNDFDTDTVIVIETNIDDITGEQISFVQSNLFEAGALDVWTTPIYMKNSRPAVKLSIICEKPKINQIERIMLSQATFGVRKYTVNRDKLFKKRIKANTKFGPVDVKIGLMGNKIVNIKCEDANCRQVAAKNNVDIRIVKNLAIESAVADLQKDYKCL